ncbi:hypothetical protein DS838_001481 [Geotrichum bryndzae]|nr:hypothetical protein DUD61_002400 [Geotrichum candidum]KAI9213608.1 hypothetical protein DS838_001481 [Geotrichum bryndzae]
MSTVTATTTAASMPDSANPAAARLVFTKKAINVSSNQLSKLSVSSSQCSVHRDTPAKGCEYCVRTSPPVSNITKSMESSNFAKFGSTANSNTNTRKPFTSNKTSISSLGSDDSDKTASTAITSPPSSPVKTSPLKNRRITSESILPSLRQAPKVNLLGLSRPASPDSAASVADATTATCTASESQAAKTYSSLPASPVTSSIKLPRSNSFAVPPPRQLRSLKTPLYVPSVLRRTQTSENFAGLSKQYLKNHHHSHSSVGSSSSALNALGTPSQSHWKPDHSRSACKACGEQFSLFLRRHHCRKCGDLFCDKDTSHEIRLDADCQFHVLGSKVKACDNCYRDYLAFMKTVVVDHSATNTTSARHYYSHSTTNCYNNPGGLQLVDAAATPPSAVESFDNSPGSQYRAVPANWSWSTF